jgi:photosystem II stability/assembly factor-like uncharacterized protein
MSDLRLDGGARRTMRLLTPLLAGAVVLLVVVSASTARHAAVTVHAISGVPSSPAALAPSVSTPSALVSSAAVSAPGLSSPPTSPGFSSLLPPVSPSDQPANLSLKAARWHDGGEAVITPASAPGSTMIDGANDLVAVGATVLAATDQGVARSTDNGATWRYVLTGVDLWSITRAGNGFVALGQRGGPDDNGPGVVATSPDGVTWQLIDPVVPQSPQAVVPFGYGDRIAATGTGAHAIDLAVPDIVASSAGGDTLRSVDGGRTWVNLSTSLNTGIDVLPDGVTMYATGSTNADSCSGAVYRSTDAGAHWTLLPGSCQNRPLYAVTFVDPDHGFAAGGTPAKYDGSDIVEATDDGGRTWQVRWSTPLDPSIGDGRGGPDNEIVRLAFADAQHGYAVSGGCVDGQNGPCGGNLYVTSDAGHSWQLTGRDGLGVATAGTDVYLSDLPQRDGPSLAISTDDGQHWTAHSSAAQVSSQTVAGSGTMLWWQTNIGIFSSDDAGAHWAPSTATAIGSLPMYADPLQAAPPNDLLALVPSTGEIWSSADGAETARLSAVGLATNSVEAAALGPDGRAAAIVGHDDNCESPQLAAKMAQVKPGWTPETRPGTLYLSTDAGGHWDRAAAATLPYPFASFEPGSLAISSSLIAAMDVCTNLELSSDGGRSWTTITPPHASSGCTVALQGKEIWLDCPANVAHSSDAGGTWTSYVTNPGGVDSLSQPLEPVGPDTAIVSVGGSLWRTTDGGAHWTQSWPRLVGES